MARFFISLDLAVGALITLPDKVAHHCRVLRLKEGDPIVLFNGTGGSYVANLIAILEKKRITAEVNAFNPNEVELNYAITLAQALPEASKMDWIVEKAVESGVAEIQPLTTQRCVTRLSDERAQKRHAHWQGIVESASEQCGRNQLTHLHSLLNFTTWINQPPSHQRIILSPSSEVSLSNWARQHPAQAVTLMIGPEGGFTDAEQLLAIKQGAICLSIGPRVMRTETAGLCAVTVLNAHWDIAPLKKGSEIN